MRMTRALMSCVAAGVLFLIGCAARNTASEGKNATSTTSVLPGKPDIEDVYVARSTFTSENLPSHLSVIPLTFPPTIRLPGNVTMGIGRPRPDEVTAWSLRSMPSRWDSTTAATA